MKANVHVNDFRIGGIQVEGGPEEVAVFLRTLLFRNPIPSPPPPSVAPTVAPFAPMKKRKGESRR